MMIGPVNFGNHSQEQIFNILQEDLKQIDGIKKKVGEILNHPENFKQVKNIDFELSMLKESVDPEQGVLSEPESGCKKLLDIANPNPDTKSPDMEPEALLQALRSDAQEVHNATQFALVYLGDELKKFQT